MTSGGLFCVHRLGAGVFSGGYSVFSPRARDIRLIQVVAAKYARDPVARAEKPHSGLTLTPAKPTTAKKAHLTHQNRIRPICQACRRVGDGYRPDTGGVWHALVAPNKGIVDLQGDRQPKSHSNTAWHSKIENTVRYLGVDVDDALSLSEATEI